MFHEKRDGLNGGCPRVGWGETGWVHRGRLGFGFPFTPLLFEISQTYGTGAKTVHRILVSSSPRFSKHFMTFAPSLSVCVFLKCLRVEDRVQGWGAELEETS